MPSGPPPSPPRFGCGPNPGDWGTIETGTPTPLTFTAGAFAGYPGQSVAINSIDFGGDPRFALSGIVLPHQIVPSAPFASGNATFVVTLTDAVVETVTATMHIHTSLGIFNIPLKAITVTPGTGLTFTPPALVFTSDIVGAVDTLMLSVKNTTGGNITLTGMTISDGQITSTQTFPVTILSGATLVITFKADHEILGVVNGSVTFHTSLGDFVVSSSTTTIAFIEVDTVLGVFNIILAFAAAPNVGKQLDSSSFDGSLDSSLIFNGTLWDSPGREKTLRRLEVYYENLGVCAGLKLDIFIWRPSLTPPAFETQSSTITIGDVSADLSERSAFFDIDKSGEVILAKLTRLANTGPVSLLGFIPHFEDKGEKVGGV